MGKGETSQHDKPKFTVINAKLISECIYVPPSATDDDKRTRERGTETKKDTTQLEFHEVEWLIFSYKNIAQIDNLVGFANLRRLHLDNNGIVRIENLGHLTQLTWLDLSFNKISKIENLETLVNLEDLSLCSNQIREIEGLDTLGKLTCLSLKNNCIESMEEIPKLHKFKALKMITLAGNPKINTHPNYKQRVLAYVRNLKFLDSKMVLPEEIEKAHEDGREQLLTVEENDRKEEEEAKARLEADKEEAESRRANLGGISTLFKDMMKEEPQVEYRSIHAFSMLDPQGAPLREEIARYEELFGSRIKDFQDKMKSLRNKKDEEARDFRQTVEVLKRETDDKCKELVKAFEKKKKRLIPTGINVNKTGFSASPADLKGLKTDLEELRDKLLDFETDQQEANLDLIEAYDRILEQIKAEASESITQYFDDLRGLERNFRDNVVKIFDVMVEERAKETQNAADAPGAFSGIDASVEQKQTLALLDSKDEWQKMLSEAHETRNKRLEEMDETLKGNEDKERNEITEGNSRREHERNRTRVNEVILFVQLMNSQIDDWDK